LESVFKQEVHVWLVMCMLSRKVAKTAAAKMWSKTSRRKGN